MKITNMKIDFSRAGFQKVSTEKYRKCQEDYDRLHSPDRGKLFEAVSYCINIIPEGERFNTKFKLPRIYFLTPF